MDVEKATSGEDERRREGEVTVPQERLRKKVRGYSLFLYFGSMIVGIAPRLAPESRPAIVPCFPVGYDLLVTCVVFAVATLVVQKMLARVLERSSGPGPAAPRLTPKAAWPLGIITWMLVTMFFHSYLSFGNDYGYFVRHWTEWSAARVMSMANLAMATRTVRERLPNKVWMYLLFLYVGIMIVSIAPRLTPAPSPASCYEDLRRRLTGVSFTVVTLVGEEAGAGAAAHTAGHVALAIVTWMFVTVFCLSYLEFGVRSYYFEPLAAGITSAANLAMAARTVMRYLA